MESKVLAPRSAIQSGGGFPIDFICPVFWITDGQSEPSPMIPSHFDRLFMLYHTRYCA